MKKLGALFIVACLTAFSFSNFFKAKEKQQNEFATKSKIETRRVYQEFMESPTITTFTPLGLPKNILKAAHWHDEPEHQHSLLESPRLISYHEDKTEWRMTAKTGVISQKIPGELEKIAFYDQVVTTKNEAAFPPIHITADQADFSDVTGIAVYQGHVKMTQGGRELLSDKLIFRRGTTKKITHLTAFGHPVYLVEEKRTTTHPSTQILTQGQASIVHYFPDEAKAILEGNAEIKQANQLLKAHRLICFFNQQQLQAHSAVDPKAPPQNRARVEMTIFPQSELRSKRDEKIKQHD